MRVGIPKEIKVHEYRVGMTPHGVSEFIAQGHQVFVEHGAGDKIGFSDEAYQQAGAVICKTAAEVWQNAQMIIKVKEPQPDEVSLLRPEHLLFTYLHLAANQTLTEGLIASGCTAIAYETITDAQGRLPLLAPMSEVAGRMSVQAGAHCLEISQHGRGVLLAGVPGVMPAQVMVLGGGVVGTNAAYMAKGLGANVTIYDTQASRLRDLDWLFKGQVNTMFSTHSAIQEGLKHADLVIGAVLIPGASAPKLVTKGDLALLPKGAVIVDVAIDQGGCFETSRATTHADPSFVEQDIVHYCVANMPGAVANTSTRALTNVTLPYALQLAADWRHTVKSNQYIAQGVNIHKGSVYCAGVAEAFGIPLIPIDNL